LNQERLVSDQDLLLRTRGRDIGHTKINARCFRPKPRGPELSDLIRSSQDAPRTGKAPLPSRCQISTRHIQVSKQRTDSCSKGRHQVRRAERSTCGRVQIGSGFDSISRRTHSSRSRSGDHPRVKRQPPACLPSRRCQRGRSKSRTAPRRLQDRNRPCRSAHQIQGRHDNGGS